MNRGILYGIGAYVLWGFFPLYWKSLQHINALQLISHRIIWSFLLLMIIILFTRQWADLRAAASPKILRVCLLAALLIGVNWTLYVWAVNKNYIVETSLGYFINPLISVLLGVIYLRERLRLGQWIPVGLAAFGVAYLTFVYGRLPYIALTLAFSFGLYGLVKKISPLGSLNGLTVETGLLFIPAVGYLLIAEAGGNGAFLHTGIVSDLLMVGAGVVTTVPLLMFASAARSVPLWVVGLLQYIAPTLQFLIGVFIFEEPLSHSQLIGFGIVWLALAIFLVANYLASGAPVGPLKDR